MQYRTMYTIELECTLNGLHWRSFSTIQAFLVFELFFGLERFEAAWCWADVKL